MLGVRRAGVTEVMGRLKEQGLIDYSRAQIHVINARGLEAASCECYTVLKEEYDRLLGEMSGTARPSAESSLIRNRADT
jgi:Mn-dependent DtxR family transcriptional regulator